MENQFTKDPEIAQVLGVYVSGEVFEATDIDQTVTEIVPAEFQLLSLPLSKQCSVWLKTWLGFYSK